MTIDLLFPKLPPALDGIGDHTALLAGALAREGATVRILTAQQEATPIEGVDICTAFPAHPPRGIQAVADAVAARPPDWLFLQFNQFSYGRWGFNPWLPLTLRRIQRSCPQTRIAWMAHEDFVPVISWQFAIMTVWQRWQFWQLGQVADHIFFSIAPWVETYNRWFPDTPVSHLPIGSNIPRVPCSRHEARRRVGLSEDALVLGIFGTVSATRMLDAIDAAARAACQTHPNAHLLYVGPHGDTVRSLLDGLPLLDAGALPADDVSVHLQAMDVHLVPFDDGVSSRRGSFMAGLANEVASVTTTGEATDPVLETAVNEAFLASSSGTPDRYVEQVLQLCADASLRSRIGKAGRRLYDAHFGWDVVPKKLLEILSSSSDLPSGSVPRSPSQKTPPCKSPSSPTRSADPRAGG